MDWKGKTTILTYTAIPEISKVKVSVSIQVRYFSVIQLSMISIGMDIFPVILVKCKGGSQAVGNLMPPHAGCLGREGY